MCNNCSFFKDTCAAWVDRSHFTTVDQETIDQWNSTQEQYIPESWQREAVIGAPCCVLWMTSSLYVYSLTTSPDASLPESKLFKSKMVASAGLAMVFVFGLMQDVISGMTLAPRPFVSAALLLSAVVLGRQLTCLEHRKGVRTSMVLWVFWLSLTAGCFTAIFVFDAQRDGDETTVGDLLNYVKFALIVAQLVLYSMAEKAPVGSSPPPGVRKPCPDPGASLWSRLTFSWTREMLVKGRTDDFNEGDIYDLLPGEQSCHVISRFARAWDQEVEKAMLRNKPEDLHTYEPEVASNDENDVHDEGIRKRITGHMEGPQQGKDDTTSNHSKNSLPSKEGSTPKMKDRSGSKMKDSEKMRDQEAGSEQRLEEKDGDGSKSRSSASFTLALLRTFGVDFVLQQSCELVNTALHLCDPLVLGLFLDYLEDGTAPAWRGQLVCLLMVTSSVAQTLLNTRTNFMNKSLNLRVRSAIVNSVYRKALRMDAESRQETTVGQAVNLMSVDAEDISSTLCYTISEMWTAPVKTVVVMALLYRLLGPSMLVGVLILLLMIVINGVVSGKLSTKQTHLMDLKDQRLKMFIEVVNGIKILKMNAWEPSYQKKVDDARQKELDVLRSKAFWETVIHFYWQVTPHVLTVAVFVSYVFSSEDGYLSPTTAFVALSLLDILKDAMGTLPEVISHLVKVVVSFRRVGEFLNRTDLQDIVDTAVDADEAISIRDGSFAWSSNAAPTLKNIQLSVKRGSLVAVVGPVGCGKSSLLSACLGHMNALHGQVSLQGTVAYVPQQAWIQHATLRDNVLFGSPLNEHWYQQCLDDCALRADLATLSGGDLTEIGEKGINLSGGQKQRVSLARAVYSEADLYLLDDPLSAVDSHVGAHIFRHVIGPEGLLAGKTRVLVTHGLHWLPHVDRVVVMAQGGEVREVGSYRELMGRHGHFARFLQQYGNPHHAQHALEDGKASMIENVTVEKKSPPQTDEGGSDETNSDEDDKERNKDREKEQSKGNDGTLVEDDDQKVYYATWSTLREYGKAVGSGWIALLLLLFAVKEGALEAGDVALSRWTDHPELQNLTTLPPTSPERLALNQYFLLVYTSFGILHAFAALSFKMTLLMRQIGMAGMLHHRMLSRLLRAPMAFFDTTPVGRILHRFANNLHVMDTELTDTMDCVVMVVIGLVGQVALLSYIIPPFLLLLPPSAAVVYYSQYWYVPAMRQMARLEFTSLASSYSFFSETLGGTTVVRAFGAQSRFIREFERRADQAFSCMFSWDGIIRWAEVRMRATGSLMVGAVVLSLIHYRDTMSAGAAGLAVTLVLQIVEHLRLTVLMLSWLQCELVSVDRVTEYCNLPVEAEWANTDTAPCPSWPQRGEVKVSDLDLRYREGQDLVLKGINVHIKAGQKVGIVGRTGAGKSSLTLALFRLVEPARGKVTVDDLCTSDLGLHELRSRLTILPQDPVIFAGSLRMNLDPFARHADPEVWNALRHAHLGEFVSGLEDGLLYECGEGGENLSMGQRQLLCLARALLHKARVLVLDEATAAVDVETDHLIQQTLRRHFADCTVLTIAHRLRTVLDYDKILVLERGQVVEYDSPGVLMATPNSRFHLMARKAGLLSTSSASPSETSAVSP